MLKEYLMNRIEELQTSIPKLPKYIVSEDAASLLVEILQAVASKCDLRELHQRFTQGNEIAIEDLRNGVKLIRSMDSRPYSIVERQIIPSELIGKVDTLISNIEENLETSDLQWVGVRLELFGDRYLEEYMVGTSDDSVVPSEMISLLETKTLLLSDEQIAELWSRVQNQFREDRPFRFGPYRSLLPDGFLQFENPELAKRKYAKYISIVRPKLIKEVFSNGQDRYPAGIPGIARVLSWTISSPEDYAEYERDIFRSIARLGYLWKSVLEKEELELLRALNLPIGSTIFKNRFYGKVERFFDPDEIDASRDMNKERMNLLVYEMKKLFCLSKEIFVTRSEIEESLQRYKLFYEMEAPDLPQNEYKKKEEFFQRHMAKYLHLMGCSAVGTKFSLNESDLLVQKYPDSVVVESKVFRGTRYPTELMIRRSLGQLSTYMDQRLKQPKGVLAIYNFTDSTITAPQTWLGGRYWILPINMSKKTASKRKYAVGITETRDEDLFGLTRISVL